jgi:hypothetical protein
LSPGFQVGTATVNVGGSAGDAPLVWGLASFWLGAAHALSCGMAAGGIAAGVLLPAWYGKEIRGEWGGE